MSHKVHGTGWEAALSWLWVLWTLWIMWILWSMWILYPGAFQQQGADALRSTSAAGGSLAEIACLAGQSSLLSRKGGSCVCKVLQMSSPGFSSTENIEGKGRKAN